MHGSTRKNDPRHDAAVAHTGSHVTRGTLFEFLGRIDAAFARPGHLYMLGETTQVFEGWRPWARQIEFCAEVAADDRERFSAIVASIAEQLGVKVEEASPGEVVPLATGYERRARAVGPVDIERGEGEECHLALYHFDPYTVSFRFIARGDEPDYHLVLTYLDRGWMTEEEMNAMLADWLPRLSAETREQDAEEFRRRYKGLLQMWRAIRPCTTHRPTRA